MKKPTLLLTGSGGMLAYDIRREAESRDYSLFPYSKQTLDITNRDRVLRVVSEVKPDIVLNCAGYTDVDGSETDIERAERVNVLASGYLAEAAAESSATLVHFSTDYIFDGKKKKPYRESDKPNPLCQYGRTKLASEENIQTLTKKNLIIRTSWLYGLKSENFVKTILQQAKTSRKLKVVDDQIGSPTACRDVALATFHLIEQGASGVVHFADAGECSWYVLSQQIIEFSPFTNVQIEPMKSNQLHRPARRPPYSVLDTSRYSKITKETPPRWEESLELFIDEYYRTL